MKKYFVAALLLIKTPADGQDSLCSGKLLINGYAELYYLYAFNKPADGQQPAFLYSHSRHNEITLNLAFLKLSHTTARTRVNLAFGAGTYMNANYTAEPVTLKNVFEANAGIRISRKKNCWLDAGILPSHIGFESAVSKDCPVLTRSLLAESSPYFEAGIRASYIPANDKWLFSALLLNGWQRITRPQGQTKPCLGMQIQFKPTEKILINYSNFLGSDKPDTVRQLRFFHNLYGVFSLTGRTAITIGFDIGAEKAFSYARGRYTWLSPVAIFREQFSEKWAAAVRAEYFYDPHGVIINTATVHGFSASGFSLNVDHTPFKNMLLRAEARLLSARDAVFIKDNKPVTLYPFISSSLAVSF